ncbi:oxygenase MpaB family protein, partial [Phenylobacterium sp.]|uniref:oxygenase MpaB family protein n=1 Tax=Phenylobacterium sp. TaxID=1871053 RepID=UPI002E31D94B
MSALEDIGQTAWSRLPNSPMSGGKVNYLEPKGDPGFFGPGSMAWRVHANPIALAVGGVAAVILELAEPRVRTGVWEHSTFKSDPLTRMQRTGDATLITTYGPTKAAEARIAMVTRMHER